jgi:hypothetical protein
MVLPNTVKWDGEEAHSLWHVAFTCVALPLIPCMHASLPLVHVPAARRMHTVLDPSAPATQCGPLASIPPCGPVVQEQAPAYLCPALRILTMLQSIARSTATSRATHSASLATRAATHCMHACVPALPRLHRTTSTSFADPLRLGPLRGTRFLTWPALAGLACIQQMRLPASVRQRGPCSHFVNELLGAVWLSGIATFNTLCR